MLKLATFALTLAVCAEGTAPDGAEWLRRAEAQLYRWPTPGAVVRFEAETDVLEPILAQMRSDVEAKPDPEAQRFVDAVAGITVHGSVDTSTGKATAEVAFDYVAKDPQTKAMVDDLRARVEASVTGCWQMLPFNDPTLLRKGSTVTACEERTSEVIVTTTGPRPSQTTRMHLSRSGPVPERVEMQGMDLRFRYTRLGTQGYVPERVDVTPAKGQGEPSRAEFKYQERGGLWLPARVTLTSGEHSSTVSFRDYRVEPRGR